MTSETITNDAVGDSSLIDSAGQNCRLHFHDTCSAASARAGVSFIHNKANCPRIDL